MKFTIHRTLGGHFGLKPPAPGATWEVIDAGMERGEWGSGAWTIVVVSLADLLAFTEQEGSSVIVSSRGDATYYGAGYPATLPHLEVYDGWRE